MEEDAAAERDKALADLAAVLAYDPARSRVVLAERLEMTAFDRSRDDILAEALTHRPEIAAARQRVAAARLILSAARAAYAPNATLTGQTYTGVSSPNLGGSGGQIAVTLSLPLFDGGARGAAVERAAGELEHAQIAFDRLHAVVLRDITDAWRDLQAARVNLMTAQAAQRDAEAQLVAMRLRERAGKAIELETLDALAVAASARESALRALAAYDVAVAAVRRTAGDPMP
jgi:outer membrane protein TolC